MMRRYYIFFALLTIISLATVVADTMVRHGPAHDQTVSNDFDVISAGIDTYVSDNDRLPAKLSVLVLDNSVKKRLSGYTYEPGVGGSYQLCATFATNTTKAGPSASSAYYTDSSYHQRGHQCLTYTSTSYIGQDSTGDVPAPKSAVSPTPAPSPQTKICATSVSSDAHYIAGTVDKIDTTSHVISVLSNGTTLYLYYQQSVPPIYNKACSTMNLSQLKNGTSVQAYFVTESGGSNEPVVFQTQ